MKYIVIHPVFVSQEVYYFDTLDEVKKHIDYFKLEDETPDCRVFELNRELNVNSILNVNGRAGRNIKLTVTEELPDGVTEEEYRILEEFAEAKQDLESVTDELKQDLESFEKNVTEHLSQNTKEISDEFKAQVEKLKKQLEPEDAENNPLYQLVKELVESEDEDLAKRYDNRLNLPEEKWIELPPGKSAIDFYNKTKNREKNNSED